MNISKLKLVGVALLYLVTGSVATRGGQHILTQNFEKCVNKKLETAKTLQDVFNAQDACMPNAIVMKLLFW